MHLQPSTQLARTGGSLSPRRRFALRVGQHRTTHVHIVSEAQVAPLASRQRNAPFVFVHGVRSGGQLSCSNVYRLFLVAAPRRAWRDGIYEPTKTG